MMTIDVLTQFLEPAFDEGDDVIVITTRSEDCQTIRVDAYTANNVHLGIPTGEPVETLTFRAHFFAPATLETLLACPTVLPQHVEPAGHGDTIN